MTKFLSLLLCLLLLGGCSGSRGPRVVVAYFQPDAKKDGGAYRTAMGRVRGVLADRGLLVLEDGTTIPLEQVTELQEESPAL